MHLRSFSVAGYKNIRQPVKLDELGPINVIHGPNNVGKSNLLQAMDLFFRCLLPSRNELPIVAPRELSQGALRDLVSHPRELFHLDAPVPIELCGSLHVPSSELDAAGIQQKIPSEDIDIELKIEWDGRDAAVRITRFTFGNGTDATQRMDSAEEKTRALQLVRFLARNVLVREGPAQRFSIVGTCAGICRTDCVKRSRSS